jgi:hypothetical protein
LTALDAFKAHLNLGDGDTDDDDLTLKLNAAIAFTATFVDSVDDLTWDNAPPEVQQAILMLAAHWFEQREATVVGSGISSTPVPFGFHDLLLPYKAWAF